MRPLKLDSKDFKAIRAFRFSPKALEQLNGASGTSSDEDEFWTLEQACEYFGGKAKPLHPATLYKGVGKKYPEPVKVGPQTSRWLKSECVAARRAIIEGRGKAFSDASDKMVKARKKGRR